MCKAFKPLVWCRQPPPAKQTARGGHTRERIVADEAEDFGFENTLMFAGLKRLVYSCPK
jgi:hypothetical protein